MGSIGCQPWTSTWLYFWQFSLSLFIPNNILLDKLILHTLPSGSLWAVVLYLKWPLPTDVQVPPCWFMSTVSWSVVSSMSKFLNCTGGQTSVSYWKSWALFCNLIHFSFHTGISIENVYCAFLILAVMSLSFLPVSLIVLPKYVHSDPLSTASPWSFNDSCYLVLIGIYFVFWMLIFNPTWPPVSCNLSPLTFISASQCVSKQRFSAYSKSSWCWVSVH